MAEHDPASHRVPASFDSPPSTGSSAASPLPWLLDDWLRDAAVDDTDRAARLARQQAREQAIRRGQEALSQTVFEWLLQPAAAP